MGSLSLFGDTECQFELNIGFAVASGSGGRIAGGTGMVGDEILGSVVVLSVVVSMGRLLELLVAESLVVPV